MGVLFYVCGKAESGNVNKCVGVRMFVWSEVWVPASVACLLDCSSLVRRFSALFICYIGYV